MTRSIGAFGHADNGGTVVERPVLDERWRTRSGGGDAGVSRVQPLMPGARLALCFGLTLLAACEDGQSPPPSPKAQPCTIAPQVVSVANGATLKRGASKSTTASGPAGAPSTKRATPPAAAGDDLAAQVYDLAGISTFANKHRFVTLPSVTLEPRSTCREARQRCSIHRELRLDHPELLADRTTRLTLIWSADKKGLSDIEASIAANRRRQADWLRPATGSVAGRRLVLDVPARFVRSKGGICVDIHVATRTAGKNAQAVPYLDGLEVEVVP